MLTRKRLAISLTVMVAIFALLWMSHWPQVAIAKWAVRSATGVEIDLQISRTFPKVSIPRLVLYPDAAAQSAAKPLAVLEGVTASYRLWGNDGRAISSLIVERLEFHPDASGTDAPNYQFLLDLLSSGAEEAAEAPDMTWVPRKIILHELGLAGYWRDVGGHFQFLSAEVNCIDSRNIEIQVTGDEIQIAARKGEELAALTGDLMWSGQYTGDKFSSTYTVDFPGWIEGGGKLNVTLPTEGVSEIIWQCEENKISPEVQTMAALLDVAIPGDFQSATFSNVNLRGQFDEELALAGSGEIHLEGISIVRGEAKLFDGDLAVRSEFDDSETQTATLNLDFGNDRKAEVKFIGSAEKFQVNASWADWSKEGILDLTPADFQTTLRNIQFEALSGRVNAAFSEAGYTAEAHVHTSGAGGDDPVFVDLDVKGDPNGGRWPEGHVDARFGKGVVQAAGFYGADDAYEANVLFENIRLKPWAYVLAGVELPGEFEGKLKGEIVAVMPAGDEELQIAPEIRLLELRYEDFFMQEALVSGRGVLAADRESWVLSQLSIADQAGQVSLHLSDWSGQIDTGNMNGEVELEMDSALIAEPMHWWDLYGTMKVAADVRVEEGNVTLPLRASSDDLGYGDFLLPYGSEMIVEGTLLVDTERDVVRSDEVVIRIGEGTNATLTDIQGDLGVSKYHADYFLSSDLNLAVDMGYAAAASGTMSATGKMDYGEETLTASYAMNSAVDTVALPENAATVSGIRLAVEGAYDADGVKGEGDLRVQGISAAGATMHDIAGTVRLADTKAMLPEVHGAIFDGRFTGSVEVGVLEETMPIWLNGTFDGIDLQQMSEEVKPPKTTLTGLASGSLSAEYSSNGLSGFVLNAESSEGFTMNRSLVEEIMQTQTLLGGIGAKKAEKTVAKFLGAAPQRPFDSASLYVYLVDEVINGISELRSVKTRDYNGLNLTINLDIDKPALVQSLKLLEESSTKDVEL